MLATRHRLARVRMCLGLVLVALVTTVIAGCGSASTTRVPFPTTGATSSPAPTPTPTPTPSPTASSIPQARVSGATVPPVAFCQQLRCRVTRTAPLADGYALRLWSVPSGPAHPVLQLVHAGRSIAWMPLLRGQAIGSTLTCAAAPTGNCVVISPLGLHAAIGEMVLVGGGRLADTGGFAVATTPGLVAADLNRDGYLDVSARDSDYRPNFAQGHLFDHTYRYEPQSHVFISTGCTALLTDPAHTAPPTTLQAGPCPKI